jgi:glyoxylase-like metal-dependent hydrolase (beta-lactamase superfamily II)/8-oxo-dGTP pyrophosphatase MutT (NUDIX family)
VSTIAEAAGVLLAREPASPEVFLVRRAEHLRFFGGFWAFPGGRVNPDDTDRRTTAVRELFEETGVLLARRADGSFPTSSPDLDRLRGELCAERLSFAALLHQLGAAVRAEDLVPVGGITTPEFAALRYDTAFFVAHLPPGQEAVVWPGELAEGCWTTAVARLDAWTRGECFVSPPTLVMLEAVRDRAVDDAPARLGPLLQALAAGAMHPIFFAPLVQLLPLRTLALAPATHTNAYLVGRDPAYLLDPGPNEAAEQERLWDALEMQRRAGRHVAGVVLTHHHPDHIGAASASAERYGVPVWAHPLTAEKLHGRVAVARELRDGDRLELGNCPDGRGTWHLEALHTPGHASGHLAFYEPRYRLLFVGDMISTLSSVVIAPPDGDLAVYLASLQRLRTYDARLLLPAHGNVSARPGEAIDAALRHRGRREAQLLAALPGPGRTVEELAPELYGDLPAPVMRFAQLQILAGLRKLEREGRVETLGEGTAATWRLRGNASEPEA